MEVILHYPDQGNGECTPDPRYYYNMSYGRRYMWAEAEICFKKLPKSPYR